MEGEEKRGENHPYNIIRSMNKSLDKRKMYPNKLNSKAFRQKLGNELNKWYQSHRTGYY